MKQGRRQTWDIKGVPVQVHYCNSGAFSAPIVAFFDISTSNVTVVHAEQTLIHETHAIRAAGVRVIQLEQDVIIESIVGAASTIKSERVNIASGSVVTTLYPASFNLKGGVDWCEFAATASITDEEQHLGIVAGGHVAHNGVVNISGAVPVQKKVSASCRVLTTHATNTVQMIHGTTDGNAVTVTGNSISNSEQVILDAMPILAVSVRAKDSIITQFFVTAKLIRCVRGGTPRQLLFDANDPPIIGLQQQTIATDIGSTCCFALRQDCVTLYEDTSAALTAKSFLTGGLSHVYYTAFAALTARTARAGQLSTYVYVGDSDGRLTVARISHGSAPDATDARFPMPEVPLGPPITHVAACREYDKHVVVIVRGMEVTAFARTGMSPTSGTESQCVGHHDVASLAIQTIAGVCTLDIVDAGGTHVAYTLDVATGAATLISATLMASDGKWPMVVCSNSSGVVASFRADRKSVTRAVAAVTIKPTERTVEIDVSSEVSVVALEADAAVDYNFTIKPEGGSIDVKFNTASEILHVNADGVRIAWSGSDLHVFDAVGTLSAYTVPVGGQVVFTVPDNPFDTGHTDTGQRTVRLMSLRSTAYTLRIPDVGWYDVSMDVTPTLTVVAGRTDYGDKPVDMYGFGGTPAQWSTNKYQMLRAPPKKLPIAVRAGPAVDNTVIVSAHNDAQATFQLINCKFAGISLQSDSVAFAKDTKFKTKSGCDANIPTVMSPLDYERYGEDSCRVYTFRAVKDAPPLRVEDAVFCSATAGAKAYNRASADENSAMETTVNALKRNSFSVTSVVFPALNGTGIVPRMKPDKNESDARWASDGTLSTYNPNLVAGTVDAVGMSRLGVLTAQLHNNAAAVTTFCGRNLTPVEVSGEVLKHALATPFFVDPTIELSPDSHFSILRCLQARMKMMGSTYRSMWGQYNQCNIAVDNIGVVTGRMSPLWCKYAFRASPPRNLYTTNRGAVIRTTVIDAGQSAQYGLDVDRHTVYVETTSADDSSDANETVTCFIDDRKSVATDDFSTALGMDAAFSDEISKPCVLQGDTTTVAIFTVGNRVYRYEVVTVTDVCTLTQIVPGTLTCTNVFVTASATKCVVAVCKNSTIDCYVHTATNSTNAARKLKHDASLGLSCMAMHTMHGVDYLALAYCETGNNRVPISFHRVDQYIDTQPCGSHIVQCEAHETSKECTTMLRLPQYQTATCLDTVVLEADAMLPNAYNNRSLDDATLAEYNKYRRLNNVGIARELSAMCLYKASDDVGADQLSVRLAWTYFVETEHSDSDAIEPNRPFKQGDRVALMPGLARLKDDVPIKGTATVESVGDGYVTLRCTSDRTTITIPRWRLVRYRHVPSSYAPYDNDDELKFKYSFHTDVLRFQLQCEALQKDNINYDKSVHSLAAQIANSNSVRENTIRTLSFNCQPVGPTPTLPYKSDENGAYPWGERKTNNNYVSAAYGTITTKKPTGNTKRTDRWSDIHYSIRFLTGTSEREVSCETWDETYKFYGIDESNTVAYASRFNSLTPRAVRRCVTRSPVESPYTTIAVLGGFGTSPRKRIKLDLKYAIGALTDEAVAVNTTIGAYRRDVDATANEVTAFFKCYLQDAANMTANAVRYEWKECDSEWIPDEVTIPLTRKRYYMFILTVNDKAYKFIAYARSGKKSDDTEFTFTDEMFPDREANQELKYSFETTDNTMASTMARSHTPGEVVLHCMAERAVSTFQCVYSLAYLAGSDPNLWQEVADYSAIAADKLVPIAQSAQLLQSEYPNVLYLVREWIVEGVRHTDNAFCRRLSMPTTLNEGTWRVDSLEIDDAVIIVLRCTGGGCAVKLQYEAELTAHHHADALAHTIPAQANVTNSASLIDMANIARTVAKGAANPTALRLLVQAIGRQYEYRRNTPGFDESDLTNGITETAMNVDPDNNLEEYYEVAGTTTRGYVTGVPPGGRPTSGAPLYRLQDCTAAASVTDLSPVRYLAPEVSRWSKAESHDNTNDTTMRPGTNGFATPNYSRLTSSTIQTKNSHFDKYNAACRNAKPTATDAEWFDPVQRFEITGTVAKLPEQHRVRSNAARYMPPLPGDVAGDTVELYKFRGAAPLSYETSDKHEMRLIEYNDSDFRHRPERTYDDNPNRMTAEARGVCDMIAKNGIVPVTSHVVRLENNEANSPTVNGMRVGQFVTFIAFNRTYCASATSFAATLSNTDVMQSRPIQEIFGSKLGPLFDTKWKDWPIWTKLVRTPLVVELDGKCTAFVVSGAELTNSVYATGIFVNGSDTSTLTLRELSGSDTGEINAFEWSVDTATNSRFLALVTGPKKESAKIHILCTPHIYKMVENNGLLHFASHVALYPDDDDTSCVVLYPKRLAKGTYTFSALFNACDDEERKALRCGKVDSRPIEIAVPSTVSININATDGDVTAFNVKGKRYSGRTGTAEKVFVAWPERVCTRGLECDLTETVGARYFSDRKTALGMRVALHDMDITTACTNGASAISAVVYGTRANQNNESSCRINTTQFGDWCASNFAGHFFPDNKFVQTGIRAVFVNNSDRLYPKRMPFAQLETILKTLSNDVALQAGYIRDPHKEFNALGNKPQLVPCKYRCELYRLLKTAPKEYRLIVPVTVTLSGHNITPTVMNIEGWYVATARMLQAADMIRHEVTKVLRGTTTATAADCCLDVTAFGEAIVDQALINIQTLDSGLHFKDRSALKLSTHQRKAAVFRIVAAIKAGGNKGKRPTPQTCLKTPAADL
tara:strand:+ start:63843 stop:72020 length:8178 start_codon:yes stop_codon:yes gene_type:complete